MTMTMTAYGGCCCIHSLPWLVTTNKCSPILVDVVLIILMLLLLLLHDDTMVLRSINLYSIGAIVSVQSYCVCCMKEEGSLPREDRERAILLRE